MTAPVAIGRRIEARRLLAGDAIEVDGAWFEIHEIVERDAQGITFRVGREKWIKLAKDQKVIRL